MQSYRDLIRQQIAANQELYLEHGCETRDEYLAMLAADHGLDVGTVMALADVLGPTEDFDGLVIACEDASEGEWE